MWGICIDNNVLDGALFQSVVEYVIKDGKAIIRSPIEDVVLDVSKIRKIPGSPQFVYGELVSPSAHLDRRGTIHTIKWHFNLKCCYYYIQVKGKVKSKRYFGEELVTHRRNFDGDGGVMYKHCDIDDEYISLHDCHATKVTYENGVLAFVFDNGIWVTQGHPSNVTDKTLCTDEAKVEFCLESGDECDITLYVFEKESQKTIREEWELAKLIDFVNSEKGTLEFLYQYKGYNSMIIECWLWSDKKPYHRECELKLTLKGVMYCWNDLCEDREW